MFPTSMAEGMLFAGTKLYTKGVPNRGDVELHPEQQPGGAVSSSDDIEAQVASARLGAKRFVELLRQVR